VVVALRLDPPTTIATDYLLAALAAAWGVDLLRGARRDVVRMLGLALVSGGLAAAIGGTSHALASGWDPTTRASVWLATYSLVGAASLLLTAAAACAFAPRACRPALFVVLSARFGAFLLLIARHAELRYVVYDAVLSVAALAALAWLGRASRDAAAVPWFLVCIGSSLLGLAIQRSGFRANQAWNHNDVFHLLEVAALYCLWRAGRSFGRSDPATESSLVGWR
jgi:hypothetical protein